MPFTFRLDAVLKQRKLAETLAQKDVAEAQRAAQAAEDELRSLQATSDSAGAFMRDGNLQGPINLQLLAAHRRYVNSVAVVGREQMQRLALARQKVEAARQVLAEKARARMALQTLRDKQEAQWRKDRARREAKTADEVATQRANATSAGEDG